MALNLRKPKIANNQLAQVKPKKKKPQPQIAVGQAQRARSRNQMTSRFQKARATADFQTPKVKTNNPAVNAGNPAVASPPTPPPPSPDTQERRRVADETLVREQARINQALYEAALAYGDPNLIRQYATAAGANPNVTNNPQGSIAEITRAREEAARQTEQGMNTRNTFFSGLHGRAQNEISNDASAQFAAAMNQWLSALSGLTAERNFALSEYGPEGRIYREALLDDIANAPAAAPQPLDEPTVAPSVRNTEIKASQAKAKKQIKKQAKQKKPAMTSAWGR